MNNLKSSTALQTVKKAATPAKVALAAIAAMTLISASGCMTQAQWDAHNEEMRQEKELRESVMQDYNKWMQLGR